MEGKSDMGDERSTVDAPRSTGEALWDHSMDVLLEAAITSIMSKTAYAIRASDGVIVYTLPRFAEMFGYGTREMLGLHVSIVNAPTTETPDEIARRIMEAIADQGFWEGEIENIRKDGSRFWSRARVGVVDHPQHGSLIVSVHADITAERAARLERERLQERWQQIQKLESLAILAGGVAHDFNNLLTAMLGNVEMCLKAGDNANSDRLREIRAAANRAADLASQMLAYSGGVRMAFEAVDIGAVLKEMATLLSASLPNKAAVVWDLAPRLASVSGDVTQLRQVAMNLLINASEAMAGGVGEIRVSTRMERLTSEQLAAGVATDELPGGKYVVLSVADEGSGIDPEHLPRLFDPFFTTRFHGRGLGLAVVLGIVRGHDGTLFVHSTPGRGTRFDVLLPCSSRLHTTSRKRLRVVGADEQRRPWPGGQPVLVVDDEPTVLEVACALLEDAGIPCLAAANGAEAMAVFAADPAGIGAVLLDRTMPGMSGEEVCVAMRALRLDVPVLMSSGFISAEAEGDPDTGPDGFLKKPYTQRELLNALYSVLGAPVA